MNIKEEFPDFFYYLETEKVQISYSEKLREFKICCTDSASGIELQFCPWSGKRFPSSLRDTYFDLLEEMGIDDPWDDEIPREFTTDEWWMKRGL